MEKKLKNIKLFFDFGRKRNNIQHFASDKNLDNGFHVSKFVFEVIDPFINECWDLFALDYEESEEEYIHLVPTLIEWGIEFLVPPEMIKLLGEMEFHWPSENGNYRLVMENRFAQAKRFYEAL